MLILCQDLDRSNVNNAFVSGMKEELNIVGNDFNVRVSSASVHKRSLWYSQKINTFFTVGYIVGMIPSEPVCPTCLSLSLMRCNRQPHAPSCATSYMVSYHANRLGCIDILVRSLSLLINSRCNDLLL